VPTVLLIRHGQASFGGEDYDVLSPLGERQAELAGAALRAQAPAVKRVVSGTLRRQLDTAAALGVGPPIEDARWNEFAADQVIAVHGTAPGGLEGPAAAGITSRGFQELLDPALAGWIAAGPASSCERSWPAFVADGTAALADVAADLDRGETAVVVTSAGVIAALAGGLMGSTEAVFTAINRVQINGALTKVVTGSRGATLVSLNDHSHLQSADRALVTYR
jgi:broad specificity phosphatase PhoE